MGISQTQRSQMQNVDARRVLPSFLKRHHQEKSSQKSKRRQVISWDRDIVCLPKGYVKSQVVAYPRGKYRSRLAAMGLIGKIHISADMSSENVEAEIRSVFSQPMKNNPTFSFSYLQPTGGGARSLTTPVVSINFVWSAQQVAKLGNNKGCIYIKAEEDLELEVQSLKFCFSEHIVEQLYTLTIYTTCLMI